MKKANFKNKIINLFLENKNLFFLNRHQMFYAPNIPSSSDYIIIIPFDREENKFSRTVYSTSMTGGRTSCDEVNQVLTLLDIAVNNIPTAFQTFKRLFTRLLIAALMIWIISETWRCYRMATPLTMLFWYMVACLLFILRRRHVEAKEAKSEVQKIIERFQPSFEERGLRWNIPQGFPLYIELCRDYREKYFESQIPAYNPQANI